MGNFSASVGNVGLIPGSGRSPGGRNGSPLQCSCLGKHMERGAWGTAIHGVSESDMTEGLTLPLVIIQVYLLTSSVRGWNTSLIETWRGHLVCKEMRVALVGTVGGRTWGPDHRLPSQPLFPPRVVWKPCHHSLTCAVLLPGHSLLYVPFPFFLCAEMSIFLIPRVE